MPKRSTHTFASEENAQADPLQVWYCTYCGARAIVIDADVTNLPTRKTDQASVVETENHTYKLLLTKGEHKLIKRKAGYERQYRMNCTKCNLPITYQSEPENPSRIFIISLSLSAQPKVCFGDSEVPDCIQPTLEGDVRVSLMVVSKGDRCSIKAVEGSTVSIEIKDVETDRANQLFTQYLTHVLKGPQVQAGKGERRRRRRDDVEEARPDIELEFGAHSKKKIYMVRGQTPSDVYKKLCDAAATGATKFYKESAKNFLQND